MVTKKRSYSSADWRRINMRNVTHLLGVEFMHNLYNRHLPRINSIRFRNTITTWKHGQVNAYAPQDEWHGLERWLGEKFYRLDATLIEEVRTLLQIDRSFITKHFASVENKNLATIDTIELGLALLDTQEFVLGEIYKINVVQVEYALTQALFRILESHEPQPEVRSKLLSDLIIPDELTESQKEELDFMRLVAYGQERKVPDPDRDGSVKERLQEHYNEYAYMHCAYGESPLEISAYMEKYKKLYPQEFDDTEVVDTLKKLHTQALEKLKILHDEKLDILIPLMARIGVFRDNNKATLGKTIKYRLMILDEIARRGIESRENLNYYLLSEILNLLDREERLSEDEITARKTQGITLVRNEYLESVSVDVTHQNEHPESLIRGLCASQGNVTGISRVIYTKKDADKIKPGDIMVAVGTDFDLLDAMQLSSGVITEEGGLLSHASVVCREMEKPCIIGVKQATTRIPDGSLIMLDATNGVITLLS